MSGHEKPAPNSFTRVRIGGIGVDAATETEVLDHVDRAWGVGAGGVIVTPNVDIWQRTRIDDLARSYIDRASIVVADGQPLVWAARLARTPVPERVTGAALVESLCGRAAQGGRSVFVLGGGVGEAAGLAAKSLATRYPGLRIAGTLAPPFGFETTEETMRQVIEEVERSEPDLVLVGLGFPKQETLAYALAHRLPRAWFLGCGGGIEMAAGLKVRSPLWAQRLGVEWVARLLQDPSRLARRYLVDDIPAALLLLWLSARSGLRTSCRERSR